MPTPDPLDGLLPRGDFLGATLTARGYWQVDASDEKHTIVARAPTQRQAWQLACRMVGKVVRSSG